MLIFCTYTRIPSRLLSVSECCHTVSNIFCVLFSRIHKKKIEISNIQNCCIRPSYSFPFFILLPHKIKPLRHLLILPSRHKFRLQVGLKNGVSNISPYGDTMHVVSMYFDKLYCHELCLLLIILILLLLLQTTCKCLQSSFLFINLAPIISLRNHINTVSEVSFSLDLNITSSLPYSTAGLWGYYSGVSEDSSNLGYDAVPLAE
jgi:hypothetical protein